MANRIIAYYVFETEDFSPEIQKRVVKYKDINMFRPSYVSSVASSFLIEGDMDDEKLLENFLLELKAEKKRQQEEERLEFERRKEEQEKELLEIEIKMKEPPKHEEGEESDFRGGEDGGAASKNGTATKDGKGKSTKGEDDLPEFQGEKDKAAALNGEGGPSDAVSSKDEDAKATSDEEPVQSEGDANGNDGGDSDDEPSRLKKRVLLGKKMVEDFISRVADDSDEEAQAKDGEANKPANGEAKDEAKEASKSNGANPSESAQPAQDKKSQEGASGTKETSDANADKAGEAKDSDSGERPAATVEGQEQSVAAKDGQANAVDGKDVTQSPADEKAVASDDAAKDAPTQKSDEEPVALREEVRDAPVRNEPQKPQPSPQADEESLLVKASRPVDITDTSHNKLPVNIYEKSPTVFQYKPMILRLFDESTHPMQFVIVPIVQPVQGDKESFEDFHMRMWLEAREIVDASFKGESVKVSKNVFVRFIVSLIPVDDIVRDENLWGPIAKFLDIEIPNPDQIRTLSTFKYVQSLNGLGIALYNRDFAKFRRILTLLVLCKSYRRSIAREGYRISRIMKFEKEKIEPTEIRDIGRFLVSEYVFDPVSLRNKELHTLYEQMRRYMRLDDFYAETIQKLSILVDITRSYGDDDMARSGKDITILLDREARTAGEERRRMIEGFGELGRRLDKLVALNAALLVVIVIIAVLVLVIAE